MGDWLAQWPAILSALGVLLVPGLLVGIALRLRGLALWALAPVAGTAVIALLALLYGAVGVRWSPLSVALGCLVVVVLAAVARVTALPPFSRPPLRRSGLMILVAGFVVGIALGVLRFGFYVGLPDAISQTNDATFHLNAVRAVLESGSASPFHLTAFMGGHSFYPSAWHAITSLVVQTSGSDIPTAANAVSLVIVGAVWPTGIALLTRAVGGGRVAATAFAAALSPALLVFPMLMLEWGVVYPYALSLSLVPASAAAVLLAPHAVAAAPVHRRPAVAVLAVLVVLGGVGAVLLSQPASILAWALLVFPWYVWRAMARRRTGELTTAGTVVRLTLSTLAFVVGWVGLTGATGGSFWPPVRGKVDAIVDVLLNRQLGLPAAVGVSVLAGMGLVMAARRAHQRWLLVPWAAFALLYVVVVAIGQPFVRRWLLGAFYADPYRISALAPLAVVPLAAIGLAWFVSWAAAAVRGSSVRGAWRPAAWAIAAVAVVGIGGLALAPVVQMPLATEKRVDTQSRYAINRHSYLSPDERAILERLADHVPAGARVIGNPSTGTPFGYLLSGVPMYPATWAPPRTPGWDLVAQHLRDAAADPAVCGALLTMGRPTFVLDFGKGSEGPGRYVMPGMTDFEGQPGFEEVDRQGKASLWRITACPS